MNNKKNKNAERVRKVRSANGERMQKMMSFRLDLEVAEYLAKVTNKGRLLNDLIKKWAMVQPWYESDVDINPQEYERYDTEV